jgi:hypothetical protein
VVVKHVGWPSVASLACNEASSATFLKVVVLAVPMVGQVAITAVVIPAPLTGQVAIAAVEVVVAQIPASNGTVAVATVAHWAAVVLPALTAGLVVAGIPAAGGWTAVTAVGPVAVANATAAGGTTTAASHVSVVVLAPRASRAPVR